MRLMPSSSAVVVMFHLFLSTLDFIASISISFSVAIFVVIGISSGCVSVAVSLAAFFWVVSFSSVSVFESIAVFF